MSGVYFVVKVLMDEYGLKPISQIKGKGGRIVYFDMEHFCFIKYRWEQIGSTIGWTKVCALIVDDNGVGLIFGTDEE